MIIEIIQKDTGIEVSYIGEDGNLKFKDYNVARAKHGYPVWHVDDNATGHPGIKDISGRNVDLILAPRFNRFDLMQYLSHLSKKTLDELYYFATPKMSAFDIETLIGDGFPEPARAEMPIVSIAHTMDDDNLTTIVFTTDVVTESDCAEIKTIVNDYLKPMCLPRPPEVRIVYMQSERVLLSTWLNKVVRHQIVMTGWYISGFDMPYIVNRCKKLNVDMALGSLKNSVDRDGHPTHMIIEDMQALMKKYERSMGVVESYSLDFVSRRVLGLGKLYYESDLKTLYETNKPRFLAYNAIDTILPILMHRDKLTINAKYMLAASAGLPFKEVDSPRNQSEAVCMRYILDTHKGKVVVAEGGDWPKVGPYEGGFVKSPVKNYGKNIACFDVSSQYPSAMRSFNLSPDAFIKKLTDAGEVAKYKADPGYIVTVTNNLYNNKTDSMYRSVQEGLYAKKQQFKKEQFELMQIAEKFNNEIKKRGLKP